MRKSPVNHPAGTRYEKTFRGIVYLMETQPTGKAKQVGRVSPYTHPKRANGRKKIPSEVNIQPPVKPRKKPQTERLSNVSTLNASKYVKTSQPFNPDTHVRVVINSKTEIWRRKTA